MFNPFLTMMNGQGMANPFMQRFQQFAQMFQGDPKQKVQELLNSGKVSQEQYNQAVQTAQQLQKMLGMK